MANKQDIITAIKNLELLAQFCLLETVKTANYCHQYTNFSLAGDKLLQLYDVYL